MAEKKEKEMQLAIPFNAVLGYSCPICKSIGIGAKWAQGTNYCPKCGQRIKLVSVNDGSWETLLKDVAKIPNVINTDIVTTEIDLSQGLNYANRRINGVFLERMRTRLEDSEQVEGQMNIFDFGMKTKE